MITLKGLGYEITYSPNLSHVNFADKKYALPAFYYHSS